MISRAISSDPFLAVQQMWQILFVFGNAGISPDCSLWPYFISPAGGSKDPLTRCLPRDLLGDELAQGYLPVGGGCSRGLANLPVNPGAGFTLDFRCDVSQKRLL